MSRYKHSKAFGRPARGTCKGAVHVIYIMSMAKALSLTLTLAVGQPALCPTQNDMNNEEYDCQIVGVSPEAGVVIMSEVKS